MKNNNIKKLFLIIVSWFFICLPSAVMGMNTLITQQDLEQLRTQEISEERFNALQNIPDIGNNWLSVSYEQYLELKDRAVEHFVQIAQQQFDVENPTSAEPTSQALTIANDNPAPVEKITGVKQFIGSFFKTLLPWNTANATATIQNVEIKNEIHHDPLQATECVLDLPGTLQTIKNKILHHNTGMNIASYALPAASIVVDSVGHHIEKNPLLYYSGGDTSETITTAGNLYNTLANLVDTAPNAPIPAHFDYSWTDAVDWPAWTGWLMKKAAQTSLTLAQTKQAVSEIIAGNPVVDADAVYETIRNEHKTKLRAQFTGTDDEFEAFFATHPTPVQNTALYNKNHAGSLVDGMVAGLNDASKYSAYQAELLNNPTIRNAHATIRRINTSYAKPKSFKEALFILQAIDEVCDSSITPEELFALDNNPDSYLMYLQYVCEDVKNLLKQDGITIGNIKEYAYRCKTILEVLQQYSNLNTLDRKNLAGDLHDFIKSIHHLSNSIPVDQLPKSNITNTTITELMDLITNETIKNITTAETARAHLFSDAITMVCNHIHGITQGTQALSSDNKRLYENYITYDDHSYFEKLWKNLFRRNITNAKLTEFLQKKVLRSLSSEQFFITKINILQQCNLLGHSMDHALRSLTHIPEINKALGSLKTCCKIIKNNYAGFNSYDPETLRQLTDAIADLENHEYTHHTDIDTRELHNWRLSYDLREQLDHATTRDQALRDLTGYYLILLKPLITNNVGDYLTTLKNALHDFTNETIPTPPTPPVFKDPKYISSFKKQQAGLIDQALDKVADKVTDGAEYLVENGPEIAENIGKRLDKADRKAREARDEGNNKVIAWVQGALATPDPLPIPIPPAQPLPAQAHTVPVHDYDIKPELKAWRMDHGKNPEEPSSCVAHAWHGRQETHNDDAYGLGKALKTKITIQNDQKTNNFVREEQFNYTLNQSAQIVHPKPSLLSKFQDIYIQAAVRLGHTGDILLIAGLSYVVYKTCSRSSFYQIRQLEAVEKQCKHGMRNIVAGRSEFTLPTLAITSLTRLDEKQQTMLQEAITRASDALETAQATLQKLPRGTTNPQDLEVVKTADAAVTNLITLIKKYRDHIIQQRNPLDMILSKSATGCVKFMKMMIA